MKKIFKNIRFIVFFSCILGFHTGYAQKVYPQFTELRGMETSLGKTILTCRITDTERKGIIYTENQSVYFISPDSILSGCL
jgi:hypothetical protein